MSSEEITKLKNLLKDLPHPANVRALKALDVTLRTQNLVVKKVAKARVLSYLAENLKMPKEEKRALLARVRMLLRRI